MSRLVLLALTFSCTSSLGLLADDKQTKQSPQDKPEAKAKVEAKAEEKPKAKSVSLFQLIFGGGSEVTDFTPEADSAVNAASSHVITKTISVLGSDKVGKLQTLCADASGRVLAIVGPGRYDDPRTAAKISEIQVFNHKGEKVDTWKLDFVAQAINVDPAGRVYVAGRGKIARFDQQGKLELLIELPFISAMLKDQEKLKKLATAQKQQIILSCDRSIKSYEMMLKSAKQREKDKAKAKDDKSAKAKPKDDDEELGSFDTISVKQIEELITEMKKEKAVMEKRTIDEYVDDMKGEISSVHGVAISSKEVFVVTGETSGYGYSVWRMNEKLEEPKQVLKGLSGCCGQMDVQCCDDGLCVAENTKHRVALYDRNGKLVKAFGKRGREEVVTSLAVAAIR